MKQSTAMPIAAEKFGSPDLVPHMLTAIIRRCPKSREQIVEQMSARLGQKISVHMLNDFTSYAKKSARFPVSFVSAFCEVTGDDELRMFFLSDRQRWLLDLGEAAAQLLDLSKDDPGKK